MGAKELQARPEEWEMLVGLLENLSSNDANRRLLYKAELSLRASQHHGGGADSRGGTAAPPAAPNATHKVLGRDQLGALGELSDIMPPPPPEPAPDTAAGRSSLREKYTSWLTQAQPCHLHTGAAGLFAR